MSRRFFFVLTTLVFCALTAHAIVYIVPTDRDMVNNAKAIVIGTAIGSHAEMSASGAIVTVADFEVERVLKGTVHGTIRIVEMGGFLSDHATMIPGSPRYEQGARYLVLLDQWRNGDWRTSGWQLGQFQITTDLRGDRYFSRGGDEAIFGLDARDGSEYIDQFRRADGFLTFIETLAKNASAPARDDYFVSRSDVMLARPLQAQRSFVIAPNFTRPDYLQQGNFRWQSGPSVGWRYCCPGAYPSQFNAANAATAAVSAWNGNSSSINYSMSGETSTVPAGGFGNNTIVFNDPDGLVPTGIFAEGGINATSGTYVLSDGVTYNNTTEVGVVVTQNSKIQSFINQALAVSLLTHEIGHTLGFRHSDGTSDRSSPPPSCAAPSPCAGIGQAIMAHVINCTGSPCAGFGLQQWDHDAQQTVYGSGPVCVPPSISTQPQSRTINSGSTATLSVAATGTGPFTYQWYQGASGDTSTKVGTNSSSFTTPALSSDTQYWVQVTGQCAPPANSNTATITINCKPVIITQPADQSVTSGGTATLTVAFTSSSSTTVTWYRGIAGDTSNQVATTTTFTTPALTTQTNFWAQLTNICGTTNTRTVTISIASSCTAPTSAIATVSPTSVNAGQQVSLQVSVTGTSPLQFQWYRGIAPDPSTPIAGATLFSLTDTPSGPTANYWVKVTNSCGSTVSNTVSVTVIGSTCTAPAITTQPQSTTIAAGTTATLTVVATGTNLHYAWLQGTTAVGTDSPTLTTAPLFSDAQFSVNVTSDCGSVTSAPATVTVKAGRRRSVRH